MSRLLRHVAAVVCLAIATLLAAPAAYAAIHVQVDIGSQAMTVSVDGSVRHVWSVSTARRGKITPTGSYRPQSMKARHRSTIYANAPMPHSIFFNGNYAIHGTTHVAQLGRPASAGCVRLHPAHAATLFRLVQEHGRGNTRIVITR